MRILETLEATERLPARECQRLRDAYLALRSAAHRASLTREPARANDEAFQDHRRVVIAAWERLLEPAAS